MSYGGIWRETGYRFRDGLGVWKVYETLGWDRQQAMLEAAATALKLITDGQIRARRTLGHLLTQTPDAPVFDGDPPRVDHWELAMAEISTVLAARYDRAMARQLTRFFTVGGRSRPAYERAQRLLISSWRSRWWRARPPSRVSSRANDCSMTDRRPASSAPHIQTVLTPRSAEGR